MLCPVDATPLVMADRSGVEIDYCPKCRGVWLDRGELDKIIDRAMAQAPAAAAPPPPPPSAPPPAPPSAAGHTPPPPRDLREGRYRDDDDDDRDRYYRKKRRESFLGDLFDF
jgi:Zn-finger nucleic acid-binding protein